MDGMEALENMLFEAAGQGNVNSLKELLQEDPLILDRLTLSPDTPIHVAALLGHIDFVREILRRRPAFASELNAHHSSPLHLASGKGYTEVVRLLLSFNPQMCLVRDRNGLTPLHLAAIKGRILVVQELILANPSAAQMTVDRGQTILHLCVKYYQLEPLKLLLQTMMMSDQEIINAKDSDGNTILHLAVAYKQIETVNSLLKISGVQVNARNLSGKTPIDILVQSRKDVRDEEIDESLKHAGAFGSSSSSENNSFLAHNYRNTAAGLHTLFEQHKYLSDSGQNSWKKMFKQQEDWLDKKRSSLMVVASLIATMAFQVGVNPPGGVWQDDDAPNNRHSAGTSIYAHNFPGGYERFLIANTTGFIASLSIILLLMSGLPLRRKIFIWILMVITWIAITAVALTYVIAIIVLTPEKDEQKQSIILVIGYAILTWLVLMALLLIAHTIRLIIKISRKFIKLSSPKTRILASRITHQGTL